MAKRQTTQWPKDRQLNGQNTDNTMAKSKKDKERTTIHYTEQERIQDFKLGGANLKKNCAERREARKILGYFV